MSEINSTANLEYDFDLDIVKKEIKLEPYLDDIKSEFGDDILYNTEQKRNFHESNTNISQNFSQNTKEETAITHEMVKIKVEPADTVNRFDEDLDIVKEEIKLEHFLDNIKSEFGDDILYNTEQKHNLNETNTDIRQNFERNTRNRTAIIESSVYETDKIKVEPNDTVVVDDQNKNKGKSFTCDVCEFRTTHRSGLQVHKNMHLKKKALICTLCEYRTTVRCNFKRHLCMHSGEKPFACNLCEYRGVTKSNLNKHMRIHTGEKPFGCNLCEYRSVTKNHLKSHMNTHTGEKPFTCNLCEYRSITKSKLKLHMSNHTGEKPFACNSCGHRSVTKSDLNRHMSIHTGEKPFACKLCEYRSVAKSKLKRHMNTHTGEKPHRIEK